jgi:hypothetical protein
VCVCVLVFRECFQNSTAWGRETLNTSPALGDLDPTLETEIARFLWQTKPWTLEKPMPPMVWELPFITQCHLKPQLLNQILPHEESLDLWLHNLLSNHRFFSAWYQPLGHSSGNSSILHRGQELQNAVEKAVAHTVLGLSPARTGLNGGSKPLLKWLKWNELLGFEVSETPICTNCCKFTWQSG